MIAVWSHDSAKWCAIVEFRKTQFTIEPIVTMWIFDELVWCWPIEKLREIRAINEHLRSMA